MIEPAPPALETRSLNHWTARKVPIYAPLDNWLPSWPSNTLGNAPTSGPLHELFPPPGPPPPDTLAALSLTSFQALLKRHALTRPALTTASRTAALISSSPSPRPSLVSLFVFLIIFLSLKNVNSWRAGILEIRHMQSPAPRTVPGHPGPGTSLCC